MNLLLEVTKELGSFAYASLFGTAAQPTGDTLIPVALPTEDKRVHTLSMRDSHELSIVEEEPDIEIRFDNPTEELVGTESGDKSVVLTPCEDREELSTNEPPTFRTIADVVAERVDGPKVAEAPAGLGEVSDRVLVACPNTPLYLRPTKEFDSVVDTVAPGTHFETAGYEGDWVAVTHKGRKLWTKRENLVESEAVVHPYFVIREYCGPEDRNTVRLRAIIDDEFNAGRAGLPITTEEYVTYRLTKDGLKLPDVPDRPRLAGDWKLYFRGQLGVHVTVRPKARSVMEYMAEDGGGQLAYVEAVFPDESITISEFGIPEDGYFNERTIAKEAWQALAPVFIQFL